MFTKGQYFPWQMPVQQRDVCKNPSQGILQLSSTGWVGIDISCFVLHLYKNERPTVFACNDTDLAMLISQTHLSNAFSLYSCWSKRKVLFHRHLYNWIYPLFEFKFRFITASGVSRLQFTTCTVHPTCKETPWSFMNMILVCHSVTDVWGTSYAQLRFK